MPQLGAQRGALQTVPRQPWTKERVKAGGKAAKAQVRAAEADRRTAGEQMAHFGSLAGVAKDRKRARKDALAQVEPYVKRLRKDRDNSRSGYGAGESSYGAVEKAFLDYRAALTKEDPEAQLEFAARFGGQVRLWLDDPVHKGDDQLTRSRRTTLSALSDLVAEQEASFMKAQGQERYLAALSAGTKAGFGDPAPLVDGSYRARLQKSMGTTRGRAADALLDHKKLDRQRKAMGQAGGASDIRGLQKQHGVTAGETAGLYSYTDQNYFLTNPASTGSASYLATTLSTNKEVPPELRMTAAQAADPTALRAAMQEGAGHAAIAMQALAKLPVYQGPTYRAQKRALAEEASLGLEVGAVLTFSTLTSTSKAMGPTDQYAAKAGKGDVLVMWQYTDVGKDVEAFSANSSEKEVLGEIGQRVRIVSIDVLDQRQPGWASDAWGKHARKWLKSAGKVVVVRAVSAGAPQQSPAGNAPAAAPRSTFTRATPTKT